jgi:hypothetical protein
MAGERKCSGIHNARLSRAASPFGLPCEEACLIATKTRYLQQRRRPINVHIEGSDHAHAEIRDQVRIVL